MPLDADTRAYLDAIADFPPTHTLTVEAVRAGMEATAADVFGPVAEVASTEDRAVPGPNGPIRVRIYRPAPSEGSPAGVPAPALVFFHGGGWVIGSLDTHDGICRALCARTPCVVVSVDYRLAPEHRFPVAVEDAWAATVWVWERASELMVEPGAVAVGGDSAGGNLATVVSLRARDRGMPLRFQLLVYPACDFAAGTPSYDENGAGFGLTRETMEWFGRHYLGPDGDGAHHEASPLRADDLSGVAPALVQTAEFDPLRDEGEAYARRLADAGVPVRLTRYDGTIHGFMRLAARIRLAEDALDEASAALRAAFAGITAPTPAG
jgi:acetyl esterase